MSNTKSKGAAFRRIGAKASAGLILFSACAPILETISYAEAATSPTKASILSTDVSSSLEELPQTTADSSSSSKEETSTTPSSTDQPSSSKPPIGSSSSSKPSTSTSQSSSTSNSTSRPSTSQPKPGSGNSSNNNNGTGVSEAPNTPNTNKPGKGKTEVVDGAVSYSKNQSTEEFITKIGKDAGRIGDKNGIYASVMIAQAILESASGNSSLAREPNFNLFGIKGSYKGQSIGMPTLEDDGKGSMFSITANFRKYPSYKESLEDYAILIKGGTNSANSLYKGAWKSETKSYREATAHLTGRYATDTRYNQKLNGLIETYDLQRFDNIKKVKKKVKVTRHKVAENETLWEISKTYGSTIKRIKELNKMDADNSELKPSSVIVVKREVYDKQDETDKNKTSTKSSTKKEANLSAKEKEKLAKERKIAKEKKEIALLKARQVGQAFSNAVPSALFETKTLKVAGKQLKTNKTHYVAKGETINEIANKVGIPIENLVEWNNLENSILTEGQVLITTSPYNSSI